MNRSEMEKQRLLDEIAEADEACRVWRDSWQHYATEFARFADRQPDQIRNILWGYAESGRLMNQRKVNLACLHMDFTDKSGGAEWPAPLCVIDWNYSSAGVSSAGACDFCLSALM